jgi:hypothetical protein
MWQGLQTILNDFNTEFDVNLENILNMGDFYMNPCIMTIVAELHCININKLRPSSIPIARIVATIKSLVTMEKTKAAKNRKWRKYNKYWKSLEPILD